MTDFSKIELVFLVGTLEHKKYYVLNSDSEEELTFIYQSFLGPKTRISAEDSENFIIASCFFKNFHTPPELLIKLLMDNNYPAFLISRLSIDLHPALSEETKAYIREAKRIWYLYCLEEPAPQALATAFKFQMSSHVQNLKRGLEFHIANFSEVEIGLLLLNHEGKRRLIKDADDEFVLELIYRKLLIPFLKLPYSPHYPINLWITEFFKHPLCPDRILEEIILTHKFPMCMLVHRLEGHKFSPNLRSYLINLQKILRQLRELEPQLGAQDLIHHPSFTKALFSFEHARLKKLKQPKKQTLPKSLRSRLSSIWNFICHLKAST